MIKDEDDSLVEQDNFDIERNELMRLMGTAKDDMRKAIIQESLNNLDSPERSTTKKTGQTALNMFETEKTGRNFSKSPPIRPVSARMRRPSMNNLDVIQEEKRLAVEKAMDAKDEYHITYIQLEDVYEFSTSCYDPKLSLWNPFTHSPHSKKCNRWITTGLMPQFLSIDLKLCWLIIEIRVIGHGIEEISVSIEGSIHKLPMTRENKTTFTFSSASVKDNSNHLNSMRLSPSKIFGDRLLLTFEKSSDVFCVVDRILIQAVPTGT